MSLRIKSPVPRLTVKAFGPLKSVDMSFGSLTVLVGPQAAGKSICFELLKLLVDTAQVKYQFRRASTDWENDLPSFLDLYFGEGMQSLWQPESTSVTFNERDVCLPELIEETRPRKGESMFFIPAQRVLTMSDGWPKDFGSYDPGVPFAVREFSEQLWGLLNTFGRADTLFPVPRRLKDEFRGMLQEHVFPGFKVKVDAERMKRRMVLTPREGGKSLPFMVWSAGQREFVPLLLGLYWLLTPAKAPRRKGIRWVVIEELEMGLHPRAIAVVVLMLFDLMARGYRVCVSTHSPQVLDAVWALRHLRANNAGPRALLGVFEAPTTPAMVKIAEAALRKRTRVYYFDRHAGTTRDISSLDPDSEEAGEAGWGGLSEFSTRANSAVAHAVANADRGAR